MKLSVDQIISIFSAIGISTCISITSTFIQFNKKNSLDFVTTERAEWRKQLKQIVIDLTNDETREVAITQLKSQINPYGKNMDVKFTKPYFMKDGHIWDSIENKNYENAIYFLELLLKYDWERTKQETKFQYHTILLRVVQIFLILFSLYLSYLVAPDLENNLLSQVSLIFLLLSIMFTLLQASVINTLKINPSKNRKEKICFFIIFFAGPYLVNWVLGTIYVEFLKNSSISFIVFLLIYIYEFYYLSLLSGETEDDYVREIERFLRKPSITNNKASKLNNDLIGLESKIYSFDYNKTNLESLENKRKKLRKRLVNKNKPNKFRHPQQYIHFLKKKRRISKEISKILN